MVKLCQIINSWPNWKLLGYSYIEQLKDILPNILIAVCMGVAVMLGGRGLESLMMNISVGKAVSDIIILILQMIFGIAVYVMLGTWTRNDSLGYVVGLAKSVMKK